MEKESIRLGCHNFLNIRPITYPLTEGLIEHPFKIIWDNKPAHIADMLDKGALDIAIIPSIEYAKNSRLLILPNLSISSIGMTRTVLLFSRKELKKIKTIAVDTGSRTSVAMLKILCLDRFGIDPRLVPTEPDMEGMLKECDAGLIIGDNAFKVEKLKDSCLLLDLGAEWFIHTGRPFVHALFVSKRDIEGASLLLEDAKRIGLAKAENIAEVESKRLSIDKKSCLEYLTKRISYNLGEKEIDGLRFFYQNAAKHGLITKVPEIRFAD
ncbi:MAG: menaquinone biosynthesis protein [Nitrospinota bacterium]|nr:menaquinone biosynthesis protein [Nitrospinota bacterium]